MKEDSESVHIKYVCVSLAVRWTQAVTTRADVHSGRTSHRTSLWWGCRSGIRTSRTSQGRHRRGPPGWREDPRTLAGTHRSAAASGTYPSVQSWKPKSTKEPLVKKVGGDFEHLSCTPLTWCMAGKRKRGRTQTQNHKCGQSCRSKEASQRRIKRWR